MLRAILFDFDGTIAETEPLHHAAFVEVLAKRGVSLERREYYARYLSLTDRECLEQIVDDAGRRDLRPDVDVLLREKVDVMARQLEGDVPLCPGATEFITRAAAIAALAVVSGAFRQEIAAILERAHLEKFFSVVIGAQDVQRGKPDPEGYRLGWQRLREQGLHDLEPAECLAIEDSPKGIVAAKAAGMRTFALTHSRPARELSSADRVVASYREVDWNDLTGLFTTGARP